MEFKDVLGKGEDLSSSHEIGGLLQSQWESLNMIAVTPLLERGIKKGLIDYGTPLPS